MNEMTEQEESMIYAVEEPDVGALKEAYDTCLLELEDFFDRCQRSYDDRRNYWPGKTDDLRKSAPNAFPWQGASDMEVNVVGERTDAFVAILDQALMRSNIKAFPTSVAAMPRAGVVSSFLKWMRSSYIPRFREEMELGANYLLEKGVMVSYVGWRQEKRTMLQSVTLEQIEELSPDLAADIAANPSATEEVIAAFKTAFPGITDARVKKAVKQLRKTGVAEIPHSRVTIDCPLVQSCAPDGEVLFPSYVSDPQRAPYVFWRTFMTPQELEERAAAEGWDAKWVEAALSRRGLDGNSYDAPRSSHSRMSTTDDGELIMVVYAFQRLIDKVDGSEGIYETIFHPEIGDSYAKKQLLNGYDDYPLVVTRLSNNQKRLYETQNFSDILRAAQIQIKTERDSRIDRASLATMPPLMHPAGRAPAEWGPGRKVPYRRLGEIAFGPIPTFDPGSERIEQQMVLQADRSVGLDVESPISSVRQQFIINKYLEHVRDVLKMAFKLFQRIGPDEVFFQVTGNPNPQYMTKGNADEDFSIMVSFDTQMNDPETAQKQVESMLNLVQMDRNGKVDVDKLIELVASSINPFLADYVLQAGEDAQQAVAKKVTDDLAKIYSGIEMAPPPNGAGIAMQLIQAYTQQPDVAQRAQQDEAFAARLQKYAEQIQFQLQQQQNAVIGRIGTAPANMGGVSTQGIEK